ASLSDRVQSLRLPERGGTASATKLPWILCMLLLGSTFVFGYQAFRKPPDDSAGTAKGPPKTDKKEAGSGDIVLQAKGYIIPAHTILVAPQVNGKVEKLWIEEGQRVKKGQLLAELEDIEFSAKYKHAVAKLESAKQSLELARLSLPEEKKRARNDLKESEADL